MPRVAFLFVIVAFSCAFSPSEAVAQRKGPPRSGPTEAIHTLNIVHAPAAAIVALDQRLPLTKLTAAKIIPDLCHYKYRVTTASSECQAFVDQSLGYYYSYVWMEAARSAETACDTTLIARMHGSSCTAHWKNTAGATRRRHSKRPKS